MSEKTHQVKLTKKQRCRLEHLIRKGTASVRTIKRARILLLAHENHTDAEIMTRVEVTAAPASTSDAAS